MPVVIFHTHCVSHLVQVTQLWEKNCHITLRQVELWPSLTTDELSWQVPGENDCFSEILFLLRRSI